MGGIVAGAIFLLTVLTPLPSPQPDPQPSPESNVLALTATAAPTKKPTPIPKDFTHTVESGDTLYTLAEKHYGSQKYWINLWNENDWIEDPRLIRAGWELKILNIKPTKVEEPSEKLAAIYKEITDPSPTTTLTPVPKQSAQTVYVGPPSSFDETYQQAGSRFGIPWEILYGLHQMETGGRDGAISSGYGTGAQGPMQFMPGTWAIYGIDGNGDGAVDINNAVDAIFGAANYLAAHGGVEQGLKSYGGDTQRALDIARSRGWSQ